MIGGIGVTEILIILLVVLLLFGAKKLPQLARGLGTSIRELRNAAKELTTDLEDE